MWSFMNDLNLAYSLSSFIHVVALILLLLNNTPLCVYTIVHLFTNWTNELIPVLPIMNNVAINMLSYLYHIYEIAVLYGNSVFNLLRNCYTVF